MPERRRIVPDTSALLPAFFPETIEHEGRSFNLTRRAQALAQAIRSREVVAFAPELLRCEFLKGAYEKVRPRSGGGGIGEQDATRQVSDFLSLPITYTPGKELAESAWDIMRGDEISPPDSWYLACALYYDAELWISAKHADGFAENAGKLPSAKVFLLAERSFG